MAYTEDEILHGEAALSQQSKNLANTVYGFKWMIGVDHANLEPHVQELLRSAPFKCSVDAGGSGGARVAVQHKGAERSITPDALCIELFKHLKETAEAFTGADVGKCVLAVPAGAC